MQSVLHSCKWLNAFLLTVVATNASFLFLKAQAPSFTAKLDLPLDNNINAVWEYLPRDYSIDLSQKYPLLIYFHGNGDSGDSKDTATLNKVLKAGTAKLISKGEFPESFTVGGTSFRFVVLCPQIKNGFADGSSTVNPSIINAMITFAQTVYRIDTTRIYMCGLSMGGGITWDYASSSLNAANRLAGIVIAAGASDLTTAGAGNIAASNLAVLATHNTVDDVISVQRTRDNISKLKAYSPAMKPSPLAFYWSTPGVSGESPNHNVWSRTFEDILPNSTAGGNLRDSIGQNAYEWMLQNKRSTSTLPVAWEDFTVKKTNEAVVLQWTTARETEVKTFVVEKSNDGARWSAIATLNPVAGNAISKQYSFTDRGWNPSTAYYRIRVVDINGSFTFSTVKQVNGSNAAESIKIFPNPFTGQLSFGLPLSSPSGNLVLRLTNASGAIIKEETHAVPSAGSLLQMQGLQTLSKGVYYITIINENGKVLQKKKVTKL